MKVEVFFDAKRTKTASYIILDEGTKKCAVIDSVLDYDQASGKIYTENADNLVNYILQNNLELEWILETHVHADHLSASQYLKQRLGGKIAIGANITKVLAYWQPIFQEEQMNLDGSQFDKLWQDGESFKIGNLEARVIATPGHTPACVSYLIDDYLFTGDTVFSPLVGTARTDFPGGSSAELFDSVQKLYTLPPQTKVCVGHEYPEPNAQPVIITTIKEQMLNNCSINKNTDKQEYIARMKAKQVDKPVPQLILPALHVNLLAGKVPHFIKIPVNKL